MQRAANRFIEELESDSNIERTQKIQVELFGSLGATGRGHGTDIAVLLGLQGEQAETLDVDSVDRKISKIRDSKQVQLNSSYTIPFCDQADMLLHSTKALPQHSNGMVLRAFDNESGLILESTYFSIGGGFVLSLAEIESHQKVDNDVDLPYEFNSAEQLVGLCEKHNISISDLMLENEKVWRSENIYKQLNP